MHFLLNKFRKQIKSSYDNLMGERQNFYMVKTSHKLDAENELLQTVRPPYLTTFNKF